MFAHLKLKQTFNKSASLLLAVIAFVMTVYFTSPHASEMKEKVHYTVGILMPMDHMALREIVAGFKENLSSTFHKPIDFKVQNAQGDMNIQRSILQQFKRQEIDLIVPIGTAATQMSVSLIKDIPILGLAANFSTDSKLKEQAPNITGIMDEIGPEHSLKFLKSVYPSLKKITLIYSNSEKVFKEVDEAKRVADALGVKIQKLMIQAMPELYAVSRLVDNDSEIIFILKDHMIVSGIQTLKKEALKRKIPIMTSDEGSIKEGGTFALGVKESQIGAEGAVIALKILQGMNPNDIPVETLKNFSVFCNKESMQQNNLNLETLNALAKQLKYSFSVIDK